MKRTKYSDAFKANALRRLAMPGQTAPALAAELGISKTLLYRWRRKAVVLRR
jgi:transposase-like protein